MNVLRFLKSKAFFVNLGIAIVLTIVLSLVAFKLLDTYTMHGQSIPLPDFTGKTLAELDSFQELYDLRFTVIDSVYDDKKVPGSILFQDPSPDSPVKKGRNVYLTVVAGIPEQIIMPDLQNLSLRQAVSLLETYRLKSGHLTFIPDPEIERGYLVKYQLLEGDTIQPGETIQKGTAVDLVIGKSVSYSEVPIPLVIGLTLDQAIMSLNKAALNAGNSYYLDNDEQEFYRVYRQEPDFEENSYTSIGSSVNLWLRSERNYNFAPLVRQYQLPDSSQIQPLDEELIKMDTID